jgi:hypothetical protein
VFTGSIPIEGYPGAVAKITIFRNSERFDDPPPDPCRPGGLLVKGRRAIYENTYFGFENHPYAGLFSGRVECGFIDSLVSEYDEKLVSRRPQDENNPIPIITRHRDGLQHTHPFYRALAAACEKPLGELIKAEEARAAGAPAREGAQMRRMLDALGRDLSRLIDEDLKEIDEEGLLGGDGKALVDMKLIPEQAVLYMGEDKTITVVVPASSEATSVDVEVEPGGVVELVDGSSIKLQAHRKRAGVLVGQIRLRPLLENQTLLTARCGAFSAVALVDVRPAREEVQVPPPDCLQFEREAYRVGWTRKKTIRLMAPVEVVDAEGALVKVSSSDGGLVVRGGGVELKLDDEYEDYVGEVVIEARTLGATATISATMGRSQASCRVVAVRDEGGPNLSIQIRDEEQGNLRSVISKEGEQTVINVMGRHPVMRRYRGPSPEFPGDQQPSTKMLVAEIIADQAARLVMEKKFPLAGGEEQLDAPRFYVEHRRYLSKYLLRCHKILLPDAELTSTVEEASSTMLRDRQADGICGQIA